MTTPEEIEERAKKGPLALSPKDRREWHLYCDRLFELYESMEGAVSARKCVGGRDNRGNVLLFFLGTKDDCLKIVSFIDSLGEP